MEYNVLYVEIRKSFEGRRGKKSLGFAESQHKTLGKMINLPSAIKKHSANNVFAECH